MTRDETFLSNSVFDDSEKKNSNDLRVIVVDIDIDADDGDVCPQAGAIKIHYQSVVCRKAVPFN